MIRQTLLASLAVSLLSAGPVIIAPAGAWAADPVTYIAVPCPRDPRLMCMIAVLSTSPEGQNCLAEGGLLAVVSGKGVCRLPVRAPGGPSGRVGVNPLPDGARIKACLEGGKGAVYTAGRLNCVALTAEDRRGFANLR